jgi:hypothetical protein
LKEELRLLNSDQRNLWRVKLLDNPKLAQNVLKRLNKEKETEPEPLNTGQLKLLNNEKRAVSSGSTTG